MEPHDTNPERTPDRSSLRAELDDGAVDVAAAPSDIAILAISAGATFVRWLIGLNESRPE